LSADTRQSILLWLGSLALCGLIWAGLSADGLPLLPDAWSGPLLAGITLFNLAEAVRFFRQRRRERGGSDTR